VDNHATERVIRGVAVGRNIWVFFGSDEGGKTAGSAGGVSLLPASALEWTLVPGSRTFSPASPTSHHAGYATTAAQLVTRPRLIQKLRGAQANSGTAVSP